MKATAAGQEKLVALIGDVSDGIDRRDLGEAHRLVAASGDDEVAAAFFAALGGDQRAIFSTPAWTGLWPVEGRLALIHDRLAFFVETLWSSECRAKFVVPAQGVNDAWWSFPGSVGLTLRTASSKRRVSFTPPRGSSLKGVSGGVETPGLEDVVDLLAGGADGLDQLLGGLGELVSMWSDYKIAKVHRAMWQLLLSQVDEGGAFPFEPAAPRPRGRRSTKRAPAPRTRRRPRQLDLRAVGLRSREGAATDGFALKLPPGTALCTVTEWLVGDGQAVGPGQDLALVRVLGSSAACVARSPVGGTLRVPRRPEDAQLGPRHVFARVA